MDDRAFEEIGIFLLNICYNFHDDTQREAIIELSFLMRRSALIPLTKRNVFIIENHNHDKKSYMLYNTCWAEIITKKKSSSHFFFIGFEANKQPLSFLSSVSRY